MLWNVTRQHAVKGGSKIIFYNCASSMCYGKLAGTKTRQTTCKKSKTIEEFSTLFHEKMLVQTLVMPHFDYCDILLTDLSVTSAQRLQRVHNMCVRFVCNIRRADHGKAPITIDSTNICLDHKIGDNMKKDKTDTNARYKCKWGVRQLKIHRWFRLCSDATGNLHGSLEQVNEAYNLNRTKYSRTFFGYHNIIWLVKFLDSRLDDKSFSTE
ncbi:hypothetical protein ANN_14666 [Periplaneta americana]|uniref:Uncharacterized protein n=1 Tax=Periplaneta americana TaxID=6978 RepID=A0ABQ8SWW0_PERAM|nr:hypothetical protein ANN_14666 [Periplaneta americana]